MWSLWTTNSTKAAPDEHKNIRTALKDPETPYVSFGGVVSFINKRHSGRIEIINEEDVQSLGPTGLKLLRNCSQVAREGPEILYGVPKFVFNTAGVHSKHSLSEMPYGIPGIPNVKVLHPSTQQIMLSVNKIFDTTCYHPKFIKYDPIIDFLRRIGKKNATFLKNIKLEGTFKTSHSGREYEKLGFSSILSIHTVIVNKVCPNL